MNKSELLRILETLSVRPGKRFGQNFMIDANLIDFIVRAADICPGETVAEIGPGCGALTRGLLDAGASLVAIEIDKRIAQFLEESIKHPDFRLVRADACKVDLDKILNNIHQDKPEHCQEWKCVANLPYSISTPFIAKVLDSPTPPKFMLLLLQKETALRITARAGSREYGAISVRSQVLYHTKILRNVPPEVFYPKPDVESALVSFDIVPHPPGRQLIDTLTSIVRSAFAQRRKIMIKAVSTAFGKEKTEEAFHSLKINKLARAQDLTPDTYLKLAIKLCPGSFIRGGQRKTITCRRQPTAC
ncbi:MAG: ribosomal RNA small subunit methyltransferase A [Victivallales bacterium]|nr:ribosomal RNA small subunit methyltransferase A [Victivallales bacterium]